MTKKGPTLLPGHLRLQLAETALLSPERGPQLLGSVSLCWPEGVQHELSDPLPRNERNVAISSSLNKGAGRITAWNDGRVLIQMLGRMGLDWSFHSLPFWLDERILTNKGENSPFGTPVVDGPHWGHQTMENGERGIHGCSLLWALLRRSFFVLWRQGGIDLDVAGLSNLNASRVSGT